MKIGLLLTTFLLLFIINLLLKMIIPLIFADYFVKKWVIYYEAGIFFLLFWLKSESFIMKSVTILAFFSLNYFLNWYQTIKTVLLVTTFQCSIDCFNCLQHIWCQIFVIQCEYSSTRDKAPFGRPLRLRNVIIQLIHYEFERLRLDSICIPYVV